MYNRICIAIVHLSARSRERVAITLSTLDLKETIKKYWTDEESNIYKNYFDAIFGTIALILIPGGSLITILLTKDTAWANYTFPLLSICFAGFYDAYGRYELKSAKNIKLAIRVIIDGLAFIIACLFTGTEYTIWAVLPALLLFLCGLGILSEAFLRMQTAVQVSRWAIWREEDEDCVV